MKRLLVLLLVSIPFVSVLNAQDVITMKDGSDVQAKILEVTTSEIKYKKFSNPDGPVFTVKKSEVLLVRYENGEQDVFSDNQQTNGYVPNTTEIVVEGMKYNEYCKFYDTKNYQSQPTDPYSRGWAGVASALIPGLGQGVAGEWGRGALFFLGNLGIGLLTNDQRYVDSYGYYTYTNLYWVFLGAWIAFDIWSICDAVHVAKVKNMYYQDIRGMRTAQLEYSVSPFVAVTPNFGNGSQPLAGLSLSLSF